VANREGAAATAAAARRHRACAMARRALIGPDGGWSQSIRRSLGFVCHPQKVVRERTQKRKKKRQETDNR
jgi:hypothetical protein